MGESVGPEPPDLRLDERFLIHMMAVVEAARTAEVDRRLKSAGLTTPAIRSLGWIQALPGTTMRELAAGVFTDRTTLTRTVDLLVERGWAVREYDATDRRKVTLRLTERGEAVCQLGNQIIDDVSVAIAGMLDPDTVRTFNRALIKVHRAFVADERIRDVHTGRPPRPPTEA